MQRLIANLITLTLVLTSVLYLVPDTASAANPATDAIQCGVNSAAGMDNCNSPTSPGSSLNTTIDNAVNILSILVGIAAVIMIIYGGFRYMTSGGDATRITSAKNTILYALIGLVIVALAQTITKFVFNLVT